ncbi:MAG: nicotinate (nicotinamide) nucleotide adenylyltransferase [Holophagaceae bacterium]|nr:nicotinate (nicotinamide) nucleotide adenylyltransferase [Holophagaceae bacterium]
MRIGLLGGAFNPPHLGHLKLAELALQCLDLDQLRFVPTAVSPHKPEVEGPDAGARLALLRAALEGFPGAVGIEMAELERGGTSYCVDTLEALSAREPEGEWILVLGSDQLPGLPEWRRFARIMGLASVAVAPRPGFPGALPDTLKDRERQRWSGAPGEIVWLPGTELPYASSALRQRLGDRPDRTTAVEGLQPQVMAAIDTENYYGN